MRNCEERTVSGFCLLFNGMEMSASVDAGMGIWTLMGGREGITPPLYVYIDGMQYQIISIRRLTYNMCGQVVSISVFWLFGAVSRFVVSYFITSCGLDHFSRLSGKGFEQLSFA